jgi:hypothetical protein
VPTDRDDRDDAPDLDALVIELNAGVPRAPTSQDQTARLRS